MLRGQGMPSNRAAVALFGGSTIADVHGKTTGKFDHGNWSVKGQKTAKSDDCGECPPGKQCVHATGTRVSAYHVDVKVRMPSVPSGLTRCEAAAVQRFINTTLRAHELEHKRRFETYNGKTETPFDLTGCGIADVTAQVKQLHVDENTQRESDAVALSAEIDPFDVDIPNNCTD